MQKHAAGPAVDRPSSSVASGRPVRQRPPLLSAKPNPANAYATNPKTPVAYATNPNAPVAVEAAPPPDAPVATVVGRRRVAIGGISVTVSPTPTRCCAGAF